MKTLPVTVAAAATAALLLAGCGGSNGRADEPSPTAPATVTGGPATPGDDEADKAAWAKEIEADLLASLGAKRFTDTCGQVDWACEISDVSAGAKGTLMVTIQEPDLDRDAARKIATNIFNFVGTEHTDLDWVVVNNSRGVVAGQVRRASVPMLNLG